jgi:P2 family phage contractile tail tube protein
MSLPQLLKNFNVFADGINYAGKADEVTPPKLTTKTEEFRAGGMDAPVEIDMGMEKIELSISMAEYNAQLCKLYGLVSDSPKLFVLRGALQRQGEDAVAVAITARGTVKERDPGTWKAGDKPASMKFTVACTYYKEEIAGEVVTEIDVENMIRIIGGVDQMASLRAALGI